MGRKDRVRAPGKHPAPALSAVSITGFVLFPRLAPRAETSGPLLPPDEADKLRPLARPPGHPTFQRLVDFLLQRQSPSGTIQSI
jgi:hypothetical protein